MARNSIFSRRRRSDPFDGLDRFTTSDSEVHVLAVDDNLVDRTVIERLLRLTACRGQFIVFPCSIFYSISFLLSFSYLGPVSFSGNSFWVCLGFIVTAVDSGIRALQYLGLQEETSSQVGFDVSTRNFQSPFLWVSISDFALFHGFEKQSLKVDMIITDYCMPGMTGYELLKKIKVNFDNLGFWKLKFNWKNGLKLGEMVMIRNHQL